MDHNYIIHSAKGSYKRDHKYVARVEIDGKYKYFYTQEELARWQADKKKKNDNHKTVNEIIADLHKENEEYVEKGKAEFNKIEQFMNKLLMSEEGLHKYYLDVGRYGKDYAKQRKHNLSYYD